MRRSDHRRSRSTVHELEAVAGANRGHRQRALRYRQAGGGKQPPRQQGFREGQRRSVISAAAQREHRILVVQPGAARVLRQCGPVEADLLQRPPQGGRPLARFGGFAQRLRAMLVEDPVDGFQQIVAHVAHRSPSPRAIMPRNISRVPPRMVNPGARRMVMPSSSA